MPYHNKKQDAIKKTENRMPYQNRKWGAKQLQKNRTPSHVKKLDDEPQQKKVCETTTENSKPNHNRKRDVKANKDSHNKEIY